MRGITILLICVGAQLLSACATVSRSTIDHFRIDTVPQGASVVTSIETDESRLARRKKPETAPVYLGCASTPCAIPLPRRSEFIATITHDGFEPTKVGIGYSRKRGAMAGNVADIAGSTAGGAAFGAMTGTLVNQFAKVLSQGINPTGVVADVTIAGAGAGTVIGLTGVAVDAVSGANLNLYPNPVILKLAPEGAPILIDPNVKIIEEKIRKRAERSQ